MFNQTSVCVDNLMSQCLEECLLRGTGPPSVEQQIVVSKAMGSGPVWSRVKTSYLIRPLEVINELAMV